MKKRVEFFQSFDRQEIKYGQVKKKIFNSRWISIWQPKKLSKILEKLCVSHVSPFLRESEVESNVIGEIVMEGLQSIDSVAYVRFASVYKNFREARDFEEFLGEITSNKD